MMGEITVLGPEGDMKIEWRPSEPVEVNIAREAYGRMRASGFVVFTHRPDSGPEVWERNFDEFDPNVGGYMFLRPSAGG